MTTDAYAHQFSNWMKARLDEMDATFTAIEKNAATLHADAKRQAEQAIAQMHTQREAFQDAIRKQQHDNEAALAKTKAALEANWSSFETAAQDYVKQAQLSAQQQAATFKARAEAQRKAWDETLSVLRNKAKTAADERKRDLDAALTHLQSQADAAKAKLEASQKAGTESWAAFKTALHESRVAFDKASQKALEAFKM